MKKNLYIFSYGLKQAHITLETLGALRKCGVVYTPAVDKISAAKLEKLMPDLKHIDGMSEKETIRSVLGGFKSHNTVGFLTYGNPMFINGYQHTLAAAASRREIRVKFFEAVSSIDALMTLFNLNLMNELRLIEISRLREETILTPGIDSMFFSAYQLHAPEMMRRKELFLSKAAAAYPADAAVYLAACCVGERGADSFILKSSVKELRSLLGKADKKHTLFIPAAGGRKETYW